MVLDTRVFTNSLPKIVMLDAPNFENVPVPISVGVYVHENEIGPQTPHSFPLTSNWPHLRCDVGLEEG